MAQADLIRERARTLDLDALPLDDPGTYEMLGRAETVGVFQLESSGMRDEPAPPEARPLRGHHRRGRALPAGADGQHPQTYINRKHGQTRSRTTCYPTMAPSRSWKETFGVIIYQEQVMQIAQELAGYSLGEADLLRRAMGKKIKAEMEAQQARASSRARRRAACPSPKAAEIFEQVDKFAGYGFNKSHAAAYALVAYQTAFLKANYPVEFLAASMTYDMNNTDKLNVFKQEA